MQPDLPTTLLIGSCEAFGGKSAVVLGLLRQLQAADALVHVGKPLATSVETVAAQAGARASAIPPVSSRVGQHHRCPTLLSRCICMRIYMLLCIHSCGDRRYPVQISCAHVLCRYPVRRCPVYFSTGTRTALPHSVQEPS